MGLPDAYTFLATIFVKRAATAPKNKMGARPRGRRGVFKGSKRTFENACPPVMRADQAKQCHKRHRTMTGGTRPPSADTSKRRATPLHWPATNFKSIQMTSFFNRFFLIAVSVCASGGLPLSAHAQSVEMTKPRYAYVVIHLDGSEDKPKNFRMYSDVIELPKGFSSAKRTDLKVYLREDTGAVQEWSRKEYAEKNYEWILAAAQLAQANRNKYPSWTKYFNLNPYLSPTMSGRDSTIDDTDLEAVRAFRARDLQTAKEFAARFRDENSWQVIELSGVWFGSAPGSAAKAAVDAAKMPPSADAGKSTARVDAGGQKTAPAQAPIPTPAPAPARVSTPGPPPVLTASPPAPQSPPATSPIRAADATPPRAVMPERKVFDFNTKKKYASGYRPIGEEAARASLKEERAKWEPLLFVNKEKLIATDDPAPICEMVGMVTSGPRKGEFYWRCEQTVTYEGRSYDFDLMKKGGTGDGTAISR